MSCFRFQQFSLQQQRSGMKICTDATLFGAMMPIKGGERVLDIGTGCGLLALMAAQLGAGSVTAVELSPGASQDALDNAADSPWAEQIEVVNQDIRHYAEESNLQFDLVISNPPFFSQHAKAAEPRRNLARHNDQLPYDELLCVIDQLLGPSGRSYLLLPVFVVEQITSLASQHHLHPVRRCDYRGYEHNQSKVCALTLARETGATEHSLMTIYQGHRQYSPQSAAYLSPFLLRFAQAR